MSIISTPNKVKLFYGDFAIATVVQSGSGNVIVVSDGSGLLRLTVGDYILPSGNSNLSGLTTVTEIIDSNFTFRVAYSSGSGSVAGGSFSKGAEIPVYFADDESFEIISKPKNKIDWSTIENIVGYRTLVNIKTEPLSDVNREILYRFAIDDIQIAIVNGTQRNVYLRDDTLAIDLLKGLFVHPIVDIELVDKTITRLTDTTFTGDTNSYGYSTTYPTGAKVKLTMNWTGVDVSRNFSVNLAQPYGIKIQRKDWNYVDDELGRVTFGFKGSVFIDFGTFGLNQTESQLDDDRLFIKHFVLAPTKTIAVTGTYSLIVVNDFNEVRYSYLSNYIYAKTLQLNFTGKSIQTMPSSIADTFTLDDDILGILDGTGVLG